MQPTISHLMPTDEIANLLNVARSTVNLDLSNAIQKLRAEEGGFNRKELYDLINARILSNRVAALEELGGQRCISAECNPEWINKWSPGGEDEPAQRRAQRRRTIERGGEQKGFLRRA